MCTAQENDDQVVTTCIMAVKRERAAGFCLKPKHSRKANDYS